MVRNGEWRKRRESFSVLVGARMVLSLILDFVDDDCGHDAVLADHRNSPVITVI